LLGGSYNQKIDIKVKDNSPLAIRGHGLYFSNLYRIIKIGLKAAKLEEL
jgi:hypothetical protein